MPAAPIQGVPAIRPFPYLRYLRLAGVLSACLWLTAPVSADDGPAFEFVEREPWKEQPMELPPMPDGKHYVEVPLQIAGSDLEMFIDEPSLSIGEDGVVRYALLLRSPTGSENLFYEGIRCSTREWRTYAYGDSAGGWSPVDESRAWGPIRNLGVERYRDRLYRYYLCDPALGTLLRAEMLKRMRYGLPTDDRFH